MAACREMRVPLVPDHNRRVEGTPCAQVSIRWKMERGHAAGQPPRQRRDGNQPDDAGCEFPVCQRQGPPESTRTLPAGHGPPADTDNVGSNGRFTPLYVFSGCESIAVRRQLLAKAVTTCASRWARIRAIDPRLAPVESHCSSAAATIHPYFGLFLIVPPSARFLAGRSVASGAEGTSALPTAAPGHFT
jgi:hypothetical protein